MSLVRRLARVSLVCGWLAVLALGNGCKGNDPVAAPRTTRRSPAVQIAGRRNGSTINPIGLPGIFDASQDQRRARIRALEYPATNHVEVDVTVLDRIEAGPSRHSAGEGPSG